MGSRGTSGQRVVLDLADRCQRASLDSIGLRARRPIPVPRRSFLCRERDGRVSPTPAADAMVLRGRFWFSKHYRRGLVHDNIAQEEGQGCSGAPDVVCVGVPGAADGPTEGETACEREVIVEAYFGGCGACDICMEGWGWECVYGRGRCGGEWGGRGGDGCAGDVGDDGGKGQKGQREAEADVVHIRVVSGVSVRLSRLDRSM